MCSKALGWLGPLEADTKTSRVQVVCWKISWCNRKGGWRREHETSDHQADLSPVTGKQEEAELHRGPGPQG